MVFRVVPDDLEAFSAQVDRAADAAVESKIYVERYAGAGQGGDPFDLAKSAHENAVATIVARLQGSATALRGSGSELRAAARYYRVTDRASAEKIDATLPNTAQNVPSPLTEAWKADICRPGAYQDDRRPLDRLVAVGEPDYSHPLSVLDNISVSHWANEAFSEVFGFDPIGRITDYVAGDWTALAQTGIAIGNIAEAVYDLGFNVQAGTIYVSGDWEGTAAAAATTYFTSTANRIAAWREPMKEISRQYEIMGHGVASAAEALSGIIKSLLDSAILAGIAAAGGTIASETGVGALIGYGIAAAEVANMLRLWGQATSLMQGIYGAVQAAVGIIEIKAADLGTAALPALDAGGGYDHPLVTA